MEGWILINRSLLKWEWVDCPETLALWIHILMRANYKDIKWHGEVVERGSFITSRDSLSKEVGITVQQVRTGLQRLQDNQAIEIKSTNKYTKIIVCKYDTYQCENLTCNQQITSKQPTNNQQITTSKIRERNIKKEDISKDISKKESLDLESAARRIYDCYPSRDPVSSRRTGKSTKDIDKIVKLLKEGHTEQSLVDTIKIYTSESTGYMQNFKTFLNHLPDYSDIVKQPKTEIKSKYQC